MHNLTAISYSFSNMGPQLVILTLQAFSMTLQLLHLSCLFLLLSLHVLMPIEELISDDWFIGILGIMTTLDELDAEGGINRASSDEGLLDSR